jgi:hypothetical protein
LIYIKSLKHLSVNVVTWQLINQFLIILTSISLESV